MKTKLWWFAFIFLATVRDIASEGVTWAWLGHQRSMMGLGEIE